MSKFDKDSLGTRMKEYEEQAKPFLLRRTPVIIRVDGRAFHTFTRRCEKPYDQKLGRAMQFVAEKLVEGIQGAQIAYVQSDEVSVLIRDWDTNQTTAWFDNNLQKMVSLASAIATNAFNSMWFDTNGGGSFTYQDMVQFDARAFNIPKEEVCNYFIWRQQDATRNSINMLAQSLFSHKQLQGKNTRVVQDMMVLEKNVNWNDRKVWEKRGACAYRVEYQTELPFVDVEADPVPVHGSVPTTRTRVMTDLDIPIFTQDRQFIERHLVVESPAPEQEANHQESEVREVKITLRDKSASLEDLTTWIGSLGFEPLDTPQLVEYTAKCLLRGESWRPAIDQIKLTDSEFASKYVRIEFDV